jgi:hypothetical protein
MADTEVPPWSAQANIGSLHHGYGPTGAEAPSLVTQSARMKSGSRIRILPRASGEVNIWTMINCDDPISTDVNSRTRIGRGPRFTTLLMFHEPVKVGPVRPPASNADPHAGPTSDNLTEVGPTPSNRTNLPDRLDRPRTDGSPPALHLVQPRTLLPDRDLVEQIPARGSLRLRLGLPVAEPAEPVNEDLGGPGQPMIWTR